LKADNNEPAALFRLETARQIDCRWDELNQNNRMRWRKKYRESKQVLE